MAKRNEPQCFRNLSAAVCLKFIDQKGLNWNGNRGVMGTISMICFLYWIKICLKFYFLYNCFQFADDFWKSCCKTRNFSFATMFSNLVNNDFPFLNTDVLKDLLLQTCCMWERVQHNKQWFVFFPVLISLLKYSQCELHSNIYNIDCV